MDKNDLAALELAISQTLADPDPGRAEQVKSMLQEEDRVRVGEFCSYSRQMDTLRLRPWDTPPCWLYDDPEEVLASDQNYQHGEREAATLLLRMQEFGVSQYHPDPMQAIEDACSKIQRRGRDKIRRKRRRRQN